MKIRLHGFIDIFLIVDIKETERQKKFVARRIIYNSKEENLIVYEADFMDFIELLNCFTNNLLDVARKYELSYKNGGGYVAKIVSKNKEKYLRIITVQYKKEIFLSKYDCKVIISNFNKIYSKCTRAELL